MINYITEFTLEEFKIKLCNAGFEWYRANQIFRWFYKHLLSLDNFDKINIPRRLKQYLKINFLPYNSRIQKTLESDDGTKKLIIRLEDNNYIETVLIPQRWKNQNIYTLCISIQVGCPIRCVFCASGKNGLIRNLSTSEIVEQVLIAIKITKIGNIKTRSIQNIVIMGMGEPLVNIDNVIKALKIIHNPQGLNIGWNKITLSTIGIKGKLERLIKEKVTPNLALSLHSADDNLRRKLIPSKAIYPIPELLKDALEYKNITKKEVTIEYILLHNINDAAEDARKLASLLQNFPFKVNLIPYNLVEGFNYKTPKEQDILKFENILRQHNINTTIRKSTGNKIQAACGQLALKKL